MSLSVAISQFLHEFEILKTDYVGMALRALVGDLSLIEQAQNKLQLHARLTLVKRIAMGRPAASASVQEIERIIEGTSHLMAKHEELTQTLRSAAEGTLRMESSASHSLHNNQRLWIPTEEEISECNAQTVGLQHSLQTLADTLRRSEAGAVPIFGG